MNMTQEQKQLHAEIEQFTDEELDQAEAVLQEVRRSRNHKLVSPIITQAKANEFSVRELSLRLRKALIKVCGTRNLSNAEIVLGVTDFIRAASAGIEEASEMDADCRKNFRVLLIHNIGQNLMVK